MMERGRKREGRLTSKMLRNSCFMDLESCLVSLHSSSGSESSKILSFCVQKSLIVGSRALVAKIQIVFEQSILVLLRRSS
jgi:hypothetical protein